MPIIIDNFHVETALPIDNRFVVGGADSFYQNKDDIQNKYLGLRIWDLNDDIPYCWKGTVEGWVSENSVGVSADSTSDVNYIPLFTTGPTVIGKSLLYQTIGNQIGIGILPTSLINPNTEVNGSSISFASSGLHVAGNIKTNNFLIGKGGYITELNAGNVSSGLLDIRYISHLQSNGSGLSSAQYVLSNIGLFNSVTWKLANTLSVANADISNKITITDDNSSPSFNYITFALGIGDQQLKISSSKMQFRPNTGQLFLSDGSPTDPVYSFLSNLSTGFYYSYSGNGNAVPSTIQGIGTSINGVEITRTNQNGLIVNNRIYIPTASNNTDVGYGIVWSTNGNSTNDTDINDGFVYNGKRLNFYGIGSHIPTEATIPNSLYTFGTYIAGYFGVDIFSGGRLKVKVSELNDVTINSRLNINLTDTNFDTLASSTNANLVLSTLTNKGGINNFVAVKDWSVRSAQVPNTPAQDSWLTWKHHNGITIDGYYNTPNGPAKIGTDPDSPAYGTLTFWERHPFLHEQYFGSENRKTLTINSSTSPFVKVDGFLKVNSNIYNVTGNSFIGTYSVVSTKTLEDVLNNNLPKTIKTGMFDIGGQSMYTTVPNANGKFVNITVNDSDFANYLKWIEIPYNSPELNNVAANQTSYISGPSIEPLNNAYNGVVLSGVTTVTGRAKFDTYGTRNSFQQGWHNIKGYKVFQIQQRGSNDSRFKVVMYKDPAYIADFNSGKLTEWKLDKNFSSVSVAYGGIGNDSRHNFIQFCPTYYPIPTYFRNQPGMSDIEIYIKESGNDYQDVALVMGFQRRSVNVPTTLNTNLPGIPLGSYTGI